MIKWIQFKAQRLVLIVCTLSTVCNNTHFYIVGRPRHLGLLPAGQQLRISEGNRLTVIIGGFNYDTFQNTPDMVRIGHMGVLGSLSSLNEADTAMAAPPTLMVETRWVSPSERM